jgi:hypothetical protein
MHDNKNHVVVIYQHTHWLYSLSIQHLGTFASYVCLCVSGWSRWPMTSLPNMYYAGLIFRSSFTIIIGFV